MDMVKIWWMINWYLKLFECLFIKESNVYLNWCWNWKYYRIMERMSNIIILLLKVEGIIVIYLYWFCIYFN